LGKILRILCAGVRDLGELAGYGPRGEVGVAGLGKECLGMSVVVFRIPGIPRWVGSGKDRRAKPEDFGAQGGTPPFLLICNLYY